MNLNQLKYFHAVGTFLSVSVASEHLHISQPSLSNALKSLESEFGVTLFMRRHHGMELTNEGRVLFNMCDRLLESAQQVENMMLDLGKKKKTIRIGIPPMIGLLFLPDIYEKFLKENPDIKLETTEDGKPELLQKLSSEYLDIAILPHNRPFENTFSVQAVTEFEIVCCVSKESELAKLSVVHPKDLLKIPVVLFKNNFFQTEEIKKWYSCENVTPNVLMQTDQLSTMINMVSKNISAGFMFRQLVDTNSDLIPLRLEQPVFIDVSLVWKKDAFSFSALTKFKEYIKSY